MTAPAPAPSFHRCVRQGLIHSVPFLLVILPFGLLFGVVAAGAGLSLAQITGFTTLVLAGASQFTAVQLMTESAPVWLVILSALAVNLRLMMYSASLVPHLGQARPRTRALLAFFTIDQTYALSIDQFQRRPEWDLSARLGYFTGTAIGLCVPWVAATVAGATIGNALPAELPLDFAVPITFLAMIAPSLRTLAHVTAAAVSILLALALSGLPSGVGLLIAAPCAMAAGAAVETWALRRAAS
ncbi:MAG: AzlC family ABC transporter permease [Paracoccus sp. (in: a-proteobacteria)]|nr:AzlC family ABC transporter permease [Paracoccus sp. (in: a-proteobacteria)]